jgi:hypothetical protein
VRSAQRLVELVGRDGEPGPVELGVSVGLGLAVDQRSYGVEREPGARHTSELVAAQHGLGVLVAAAPDVWVVGVNRLVAGQAAERPAGVIEHPAPAR